MGLIVPGGPRLRMGPWRRAESRDLPADWYVLLFKDLMDHRRCMTSSCAQFKEAQLGSEGLRLHLEAIE